MLSFLPLVPVPAVNVAYLAVPTFAVAQQVLVAAKRQLGEVLSAFEFLDRESLAITLRHLPGTKDPLPGCQVGEAGAGSTGQHWAVGGYIVVGSCTPFSLAAVATGSRPQQAPVSLKMLADASPRPCDSQSALQLDLTAPLSSTQRNGEQ